MTEILKKESITLGTEEKKLSGLERAREIKKQNKELGIEDKRRNPREVWEEDRLSLRKAINAKCYDCSGEENYRNRTRFCHVTTCSLWPVRPYGKDVTETQCLDYKED